MDAAPSNQPARPTLPAQRIDADGRSHVDLRAIILLAAPFAANSAIQSVLNLTDTWFIGQISTDALAAAASIHWPTIAFIALFGGVALASQTIVAQAFGGRRRARAAQAAWISIWAALFTLPLFVIGGVSGRALLHPFGLDPHVEALALTLWQPRITGASLGVVLWGVLGFFNGIGRPGVTLAVDAFVCVVNAVLNQVFIFQLDLGIAGAAYATNCAQALGVIVSLVLLLSPKIDATFRTRLMWRLRLPKFWWQWRFGFPMGLLIAADVLGFALFQLMQVHLSPVDGAATQIVMMATSIAFMPAVGIGLASTTLVGQSIGMGERAWARRLGNTIILMCMTYMGSVGVLLGLTGPWLIPTFLAPGDPHADAVLAVGLKILWIGAAYQLFDGINFGASFSLRGAGDASVPALLVMLLSGLVFVPLAHMLSFERGQGFVDGLPQFGLGAVGGWLAALTYICALSVCLLLRWRSGAWERVRVR
jgi:MATE family multidrug resistance protein